MSGERRCQRILTLSAVLCQALTFGFHAPRHRQQAKFCTPSSALSSTSYDDSVASTAPSTSEDAAIRGPLSLTLQELSDELEGSGRAAATWDCLRVGIDPNLYYQSQDGRDASDGAMAEAWLAATAPTMSHAVSNIDESEYSMAGRRQGQGLGAGAWNRLQSMMGDYWHSNNTPNSDVGVYTIENSVASLSHMSVSPDGTTKLLLKMLKDGLEVESVIIPWLDKGFSTLCVS